MDSHETDAPLWLRPLPDDDPAASHETDDVIVIESHETAYTESGPDDAAEPDSDLPAEDAPVAPAVSVAREEPVAAPAAASAHSAPSAPSAPIAHTADGDTARWSEIKAMFVDDPGESVKLASGLVERAIENLMAALRQRQESLAPWESGDAAGTEELRNALRGYRSLFDELDGLSGRLGPEPDLSGHDRSA